MTTARDIITSALRKIHVLGTGASLDSTEANDALETLNEMISSFSAEGAMTFQEVQETFNLTSNQESYTIGSGQDFDTTAPLYITAAYVRQGETDYSVTQYDEREYAGISQKTTGGSTPSIYYYNNNFPVARIYFYPVPSSADTFTWFCRKYLTSFADLDTDFAMPEQYKAMLVYNLAIWIAPEYEREPSRSVMSIAKRTKKTIIAQNSRNEKYTSNLSGIPSRGGSTKYSEHNIYGGYFT